MYVGTHYNGYYNSLFGDRGSIYSSFSKNKTNNNFTAATNNISNSSSSVKYVQDLKSGANQLYAAISSLSSGAAFKQNSIASSNNELLTVNSANNYALGDKSLTVNIQQTASGQTNTGAALAANSKSAVSGYQQFAIETNGRSYQFSINVGAGDSNKDVQQKMADAINSRGIGIEAKVTTDSATGTSTLSLNAQSTGENAKSTFSITDVHGSVVQQTGIDQVTQQAQNAIYSVNGGPNRESASNTVDLGSGITANLLKASNENITIAKSADSQYAVDMVKEMVDAYNQLYGATLNNTTDSKSNTLFSQLVNTSRTYSATLNSIGISFDANGYMQADSEKLNQAAENGSLQSFFAGTSNYGFANQMSKIGSNVSLNTSRYVSQNSLSADAQSYFNFYDNNFFNSYQNYMNTNNGFNSGLLFDLML